MPVRDELVHFVADYIAEHGMDAMLVLVAEAQKRPHAAARLLADMPAPVEDDEPVDLESLSVSELKDMLRERDLPVGGTKAELIERLLA